MSVLALLHGTGIAFIWAHSSPDLSHYKTTDCVQNYAQSLWIVLHSSTTALLYSPARHHRTGHYSAQYCTAKVCHYQYLLHEFNCL
jgi:hypothetical protein